MSFILDALRKSDARRQQSAAPGLNSPEPPRPPRRRRRRLLPWLASGLIVLAITATAVYLLQPEWLPAPLGDGRQAAVSEQPVAPGRAGAERESAGDRSTPADEQLAQGGAPARPIRRRTPTEPAAEDSAPAVRPGEDTEPQASRDRRRPMPASPERTVRRETPQRESEPVPAEEAAQELERRMAEEARRRRASTAEAEKAGATGKTEEASTRPVAEPAGRPSKAPAEAAEPREPAPLNEGVAEYVRAWELPLSVRRSLPELDLTIHVFSPNESERFVLINGERYVAGDAIGEARIVDISRDGAIVDFRSHRFLLEPR